MIQTVNGVFESAFTITGQLAVDGWLFVPIWRNIGPLQGPGTVSIKVTNQAPYNTAVIVGASSVRDDFVGQ